MEISIQIDTVREAINRLAGYLARKTRDNGMFEYRLNMNPKIKVKNKYNILRHAGCIYALSMYYQLQPNQDILSAIERAGRYLRDESIKPVSERDDRLAVWSIPEVTGNNQPIQAKLGGTGLGLVALLSLETIHPGLTPLTELQALGQFIVYMQKEDGSFYSKYVPSRGGRLDDWQSLYYPGEAALGLLMLYEKDASEIWIKSASKALNYLARSREDEIDIPADHWALLATEKMLSLKEIDQYSRSKALLIDHAIQICDTMLQEQIDRPEQPYYDGGFSRQGKTTPTATRLEGLLAALSFLPPNHELGMRIRASATRGITFLLRAQIARGEFVGAIPRAVGKINRTTPAAKKFNRRVTEVRIDYIQHAMSALIQYLHFIQ